LLVLQSCALIVQQVTERSCVCQDASGASCFLSTKNNCVTRWACVLAHQMLDPQTNAPQYQTIHLRQNGSYCHMSHGVTS
jgi:hypothetical protein